MSQDFKLNTLNKGLVFHAPLTDQFLQDSTLASDVSANQNHATTDNGSATYSSTGYEMDGSTDYLTFPGTGVYNQSEVTIALRFTPDFDWDADNHYMFFDSTGASRYLAVKYNNSLNNVIAIHFGNTNVATIAAANYNSYWNVNEENTFVLTGTSGDNDAWLNGNYINLGASAWTPANPANIYVGAANNGAQLFDGEIRDFRIWNRIITTVERELYESATSPVKYAMSSLEKGLVLDMPLTSGWTQSATVVSDRSAYRNHMTEFGDPLVFDETGMTTDGTNGVSLSIDDWRGDDTQGTISVWVYPTDLVGDAGSVIFITVDQSNVVNNTLLGINNPGAGDATLWFSNRNVAVYNRFSGVTALQNDLWHHLVVTSNGSRYLQYFNGVSESIVMDVGNDDGRWIGDIANRDAICVGAYLLDGPTIGVEFTGTIYGVKVWNRELSAAEILQLYNQGRQ